MCYKIPINIFKGSNGYHRRRLNKTAIEGEIENIKRSLRYLNSKASYIQRLLEQFYSDLGLELSTDLKEWIYKKFGTRFNKDYFSD